MTIALEPETLAKDAASILSADPELPGVIVEASPGRPLVLSRNRLFETLSKPYGVAIFMNRPVSILLDEIERPMVIEASVSVIDAVKAAMDRDPSTRYEPIVVRSGQGGYKLVDLRTLLLAQSSLLASAGSIAGRLASLATALSGTLDLDSVLALVLDSIGELVPYERAIIYMDDEGSLVKAAERDNGAFRSGGRGAPSSSDPRPSEIYAEPERQGMPASGDDGWATFPLSKGDELVGYLCVKRPRDSVRGDVPGVVDSLAASAAIAIANARLYSRLEEMASVDQLTGVLNRRAFMDEASRAADRAARDGIPVAMVMLDLDRFKRINDSHGHAIGDEVLKASVDRAVSGLRSGDIAGRFGGEEFVFFLHDVDARSAGAAAERMRERIASSPILCKCGPVPVTASLGIAAAVPAGEATLAALIEAADAAMYKAKRAGRNRVRFAEPASGPAAPGRHAEKTGAHGTARATNADQSGQFLRVIDSLLQALAQGSRFAELSSMALEGLSGIVRGSAAALLDRADSASGLAISAQACLSDGMVGRVVDKGDGLAARAALERRVYRASRGELESSGHPLAGLMRERGLERYRAYPLPSKDAAHGVLEVYDAGSGEPSWHRGASALASALGAAASVAEVLDDARRANAELASSYDATLESWVRMLELRDQETEGHSRRVTGMTMELSIAFGMPPETLDTIRRGALLHDIGKMGVPDSILLKPGPLSEDEMATMRLHPGYAYEVMSGIPFLEDAVDIPRCHHERWDGSGYPRGLAGEDIPLAARLFAVVDVWDALRSDRPYRKAMTPEEAAALIAGGAGSQFDPDVAAVFLGLRRQEIFGRRSYSAPSNARRAAS